MFSSQCDRSLVTQLFIDHSGTDIDIFIDASVNIFVVDILGPCVTM